MKKIFPLLWFAAVFLTIFSAKLRLIGLYGSALPWWDQWAAEGWLLYIPFFDKTLALKDLFAAHCEHRIFVNRVMALLLLALNGQWDARLGMVLNALLAAGIGAMLSAMGWSVLGKKNIAIICLFNTLVFSLPFSWECSVLGFIGNYWLIFFAIASVWLLLRKNLPHPAWFLGLAFAALSLVTMGSGFFAAAAVLAILTLRMFFRQLPRDGAEATFSTDLPSPAGAGYAKAGGGSASGGKFLCLDLVSATLLLAIVAVGLLLKVTVPGHAAFQPANARDLIYSFLRNLAWPDSSLPWTAIIVWLPYFLLFLYYVFRRTKAAFASEFLLALGLWVALQDAALAFSRSGVIASRHTVFLSLALPVNFLALLLLLHEQPPRFYLPRSLLAVFLLAWAFNTGHGLWKITNKANLAEAERYKANIAECEKNVRNFVKTESIAELSNKPLYAIPFPDPNALAMVLRNAHIRSILPFCAHPANKPGTLSRFSSWLIPKGGKLCYIGAALLLILAAVRFYQSLGTLENRLVSMRRRDLRQFMIYAGLTLLMAALAYALHTLYLFLSPDGLTVTYFRGIDFEKKICTRTEKAVCRDYGERHPAWHVPRHYYSALWQGILRAPETAVYEFYSQSDDGLRLIIDGKKIIDNWRNQSWNASGTGAQVRLEAGNHQIAVEHYNAEGESVIRIKWCGGPIPPNTILSAPYLRKR